MSDANSIAWPFSKTRTLMIAGLYTAIIAFAGTAIALVWSFT